MIDDVRTAKLEDLDGLLELLFQLSKKGAEDKKVSKTRLTGILRRMLNNENYILAVYNVGKRLAGTATLFVQLNLSHGGRPYGHIENVVTDKDFRGKGIGKALTDYLLNEARSLGCYKVILDCKEENVPFYQKCGMRRSGEIEMRFDL